MRLLGLDIAWASERPELKSATTLSLNQFLERLEAAYQTVAGIQVTPETAMQSPTVQAVVRAIGARIATSPVHVLEKTTSGRRTSREERPNHPVMRLLTYPNENQTRVDYWLDATSRLVRHGNYYAFKGRGLTGPIRRLEPLHPDAVTVEQEDDLSVLYRVRSRGRFQELRRPDIHHARLTARDGVVGDSPVMDVRETIALEIAIERFGATFFGNGALPLLVFQYMAETKGFKTNDQRQQFIDDFQQAYGQRNRHRAMLLPRGLEMAPPIALNNEHAQFLETRKLLRTIIAGAFGVPPHHVGDLERSTYNNVEQQSLDFVQNVILPYARVFEAAMERDLLTPEDRAQGIQIRFNLDGALRGDFKTRQEGLKIMREAGALSPNEWREREGLNPREGGDTYFDQGPSGQQPGGAPAADRPGEDEPEPERRLVAPALSHRNGGAHG